MSREITSAGRILQSGRILPYYDLTGGGGGVSDGDKGDIVVSGGGTVWTIDPTATPTVAQLTDSGLTSPGVVFAGVAGLLTTDATNFRWDNTSKFLGIGVVPTVVLDILNSGFGTDTLKVQGTSSGGFLTYYPIQVYNSIGRQLVGIGGSSLENANDYGFIEMTGASAAPGDLVGELDWADQSISTSDKRAFLVSAINNGTDTYKAKFQLRQSAGSFRDNVLLIEATGRIGIGEGTPTATLHLQAGMAAASGAALKLTSGAQLTAAEDGAIEYDGSEFWITIGSTRYRLVRGDEFFNETDTNARLAVRKNSGAVVGTRRRLNLIEGDNISLTVADDAGSEEVDVTIASNAVDAFTNALAGGDLGGQYPNPEVHEVENASEFTELRSDFERLLLWVVETFGEVPPCLEGRFERAVANN